MFLGVSRPAVLAELPAVHGAVRALQDSLSVSLPSIELPRVLRALGGRRA